MIKAAALREALVTRYDELRADPSRLRLWIDRGGVHARQGASRSFEVRYTLNLVIEEWRHSALMIWIVILDWLAVNQVDLLRVQEAPAFGFEADILDNEAADIAIELNLREAIDVSQRPDGGWDMLPREEPKILFDDDQPLVPSLPGLSQVWMGGVRLMPDEAVS